MNNKETLQQNNSRLNISNIDLDTIFKKIHELPKHTDENLTDRLTEQDALLATQETTIDDIIIALQGKSASDGEVLLQEKTVTPTTVQQEIKADELYQGLSKVVVEAVDSSIDEDIKPENIRKGVDILNVVGTMEEYVEPTLQEKNITPDVNTQEVVADSGFDGLSKVTVNAIPITISNAQYLFYGGAKLDYLELFLNLCKDVNITTSMFQGCTTLTEIDLSDFRQKGLYNMSNMFNGCTNLTKVNMSNFDTSNVVNISSLFNNCSKLTEVDISSFDTSNATGSAQMFNGCKALVDLDLSHFDFRKVNSIITMFGNCTNLTNFKSPKNVGMAFTQKSNNYQPYQMSYSSSTKLTHDSLMDIINNLYDLNWIHNTANGGTLYTQKLTIGATNMAKLTSEEIATATNKGYTVA